MEAQLHHRVLFAMGRIVATPAALKLLDSAQSSGLEYVLRHVTGDFGMVCAEDEETNRRAIAQGHRILSVYDVASEKLWIITEADRSVTTLLTPDDY
jgi:hypothetical protein